MFIETTEWTELIYFLHRGSAISYTKLQGNSGICKNKVIASGTFYQTVNGEKYRYSLRKYCQQSTDDDR